MVRPFEDYMIEKLAREFSKILREWIGDEKLCYVIISNRDEPNPSVCYSHDYCDANMAMHKAFVNVVGRDPLDFLDRGEDGCMSEVDLNLFNAAWDLAKKKEFYYDE